MKILIADDEEYTREGLINSIDWKELGIDEIMSARNGNEALNISRWFKPDIVLTDIRMPKLNGIQFAKELVRLNPKCKIIFMSGYMEIEYLKSAIQLSVIDYIEKPIDIPVVVDAINRAIAEIKERETHITVLETKKELQQQKLANLLILKEYEKTTVENLCKEIGFRIENHFICLLVYDKAHNKKPESMVKRIENFFSKKEMKSLCGYEDEYKYFIIISYRPSEKYRLSSIYQSFLEFFPDMILGVGFDAENIKNIYNSYQTGILALNLSFYDEKGRLFFVDDDIMMQRSIEPRISGEFLKILNEDITKLREWCTKLFEDLRKQKYFRKAQVQTLLVSLLTEIFQKYPELWDDYHIVKEPKYIDAMVHDYYYLSEIHEFMMGIIERIEEKQQKESKHTRVVKTAMDYIAAHYANPDLSVLEIAEYMNFTATYMNVLFRQEMKITLKQYLSNYRLERAKKMLDNDFNKITDIAESCGYTNANYFAKVFKEMTNMTPMEYRNRKYD